MRIAIDAHAIGRHLTGNEVYVRNLLEHLSRIESRAEFIAYLSVPEARLQLSEGVLARPVSSNPFRRLGWELSAHLRRDRPRLIHVQYTAPLACPVPIVVSVHDVSFVEHPEFFSPLRVWQLRQTVKRTIERAARVLTPSEFSRAAIERHYPAAQGKTVVIPNAVSAGFHPISREQARLRVAKRFGIAAPFILNVGDLQPRKNQTGLILAFEQLIRQYPELPHHLVLVGQNKWEGSAVRAAAARSSLGARIHFTGYVEDEDLRILYNACECFVFPSYYEGFGIPILEAMACGCAVACSNTSAMPEVADGAAIFFSPRSIEEMTRALRDLVLDAELRARMRRLGQSRAAAFSWDRTARLTLEVYRAVAGARQTAQPQGLRART